MLLEEIFSCSHNAFSVFLLFVDEWTDLGTDYESDLSLVKVIIHIKQISIFICQRKLNFI